jgi:hypothetical protein
VLSVVDSPQLPAGDGLKVGFVWAGSPDHRSDKRRWGRPWSGFWAQLRWCPRRWNLGIGIVAGLNETTPPSWAHDVGFYVRAGPIWFDAGHGAQGAR